MSTVPIEPPSSPPLAPLNRELGLPNHAVTSAQHGLLQKRSHRKRRREDNSYNNSSDPAVFSSDNIDASLDDYNIERRKRPLVGSWFRMEQPNEAPRKRTFQKFSRNFDSGIWMGSDTSGGSFPSSDGVLPDPLPSGLEALQHDTKAGDQDNEVDEALSLANPTNERHSFYEMDIEHLVVNQCIEDGNPVIDLTGMGLEKLDPYIVQQLRLVMLQHKVNVTALPGPEYYADLVPDLRLHLGNNKLKTFPGELCKLLNLKFLTIRHNEISYIPPQLAQIDLEELNIAVNPIRYLPYGLVKRWADRQMRIKIHANKFVEPYHPVLITEMDRLTPPPCEVPSIAATSTVCYFDLDGALVPHSSPSPSQHSTHLFPSTNRPRLDPDTSRVPSLFELALHMCKITNVAADLECCPPDSIPTHISDHIHRVVEEDRAGLKLCDECERPYEIPRAEWLEWWCGLKYEGDELVPVLKQVCCWDCVRPKTPVKWPDREELLEGCGWMEWRDT